MYSYVIGYRSGQNNSQFYFFFPAFISAAGRFIHYIVITAIFRLQELLLMVNKAQESESRGVSSNSPGNQG